MIVRSITFILFNRSVSMQRKKKKKKKNVMLCTRYHVMVWSVWLTLSGDVHSQHINEIQCVESKWLHTFVCERPERVPSIIRCLFWIVSNAGNQPATTTIWHFVSVNSVIRIAFVDCNLYLAAFEVIFWHIILYHAHAAICSRNESESSNSWPPFYIFVEL